MLYFLSKNVLNNANVSSRTLTQDICFGSTHLASNTRKAIKRTKKYKMRRDKTRGRSQRTREEREIIEREIRFSRIVSSQTASLVHAKKILVRFTENSVRIFTICFSRCYKKFSSINRFSVRFTQRPVKSTKYKITRVQQIFLEDR